MKPRYFYIPNEFKEGDQIGPRKAFRTFHEEGLISALTSYSYLVEDKQAPDHQQALERLFQAVEKFQPDVIFWQHLNQSYPVDAAYLQKLKSIASRPKLVIHEGDPYGRVIKRLSPTMKAAFAAADLTVLVGIGYLAEHVRAAGAKRLMLSPHGYDDERFEKPWDPPLVRPYDAVMIGNLPCLKRIPFLFLPGGRSRKTTAQKMYAAYGERFAVFGGGQGWEREPYCRGPIAFDQQEASVRSAWLSVNWSQFDKIPFYFSDRLPISMIAGVPHITNYQRGFEHIMPNTPGLYFVHSPAEALDVADFILSLPREKRIELGLSAADYARTNFRVMNLYRDMIVEIERQFFQSE